MISRIQGRLLARGDELVEVATAGGVVYELHVPLSIFRRLPAEGEDIEMLTEYVVRDDTPSLYGFLEPGERSLFRRLLGVQKVGPRLAMSMLATYEARRLARALAESDVPALVQVSGLGKKTAQRLILELADKVEDLAQPRGDGAGGPAAMAIQALMQLGYAHAEADAAVRDAMRDPALTTVPAIVTQALKRRDTGTVTVVTPHD